jgi:hypothetical protein
MGWEEWHPMIVPSQNLADHPKISSGSGVNMLIFEMN